MPKAPRAARLSRMARRATSSDPLPSLPVTRAIRTVTNPVTTAGKVLSSESCDKLANNRILQEDEKGVPESQSLSRGQRKRLARRDQFLKREKLILSSLMLQRQDEQKRRIDGLDAIKESLLSTNSSAAAGPKGKEIDCAQSRSVSTNKAKRKVVAREVEHMNLILQHPAFKADPFETMQEHLRNTFAQARIQQELVAKKRAEAERQSAAEKQKLKKERFEGTKKNNRKKYKPRRTT